MRTSPTARALDSALRDKAPTADVNAAMAAHLRACALSDRELAKSEDLIAELRALLARLAGHKTTAPVGADTSEAGASPAAGQPVVVSAAGDGGSADGGAP